MENIPITYSSHTLKDGQESVPEREPHSGRPLTSRISENAEFMWAAINKSLWLTVRELNDLRIP